MRRAPEPRRCSPRVPRSDFVNQPRPRSADRAYPRRADSGPGRRALSARSPRLDDSGTRVWRSSIGARNKTAYPRPRCSGTDRTVPVRATTKIRKGSRRSRSRGERGRHERRHAQGPEDRTRAVTGLGEGYSPAEACGSTAISRSGSASIRRRPDAHEVVDERAGARSPSHPAPRLGRWRA